MDPKLTFFSPLEIGKALGCSANTVRWYVRKGYLPAFVHLGRCRTKRLLISQEDYQTFLERFYLREYWPGNKNPNRKNAKDTKRPEAATETGSSGAGIEEVSK